MGDKVTHVEIVNNMEQGGLVLVKGLGGGRKKQKVC